MMLPSGQAPTKRLPRHRIEASPNSGGRIPRCRAAPPLTTVAFGGLVPATVR